MDTGEGYLKMIQSGNTPLDLDVALEAAKREYPKHGGTFYVGQNLELNGSHVRVIAITKKTITLKVLPKG